MSQRLLLYGASGHGRVVADAARAAGFELVGWADDQAGRLGQTVAGAPVVASSVGEVLALALRQDCQLVVTIGDNRVRARLFAELVAAGAEPGTVIHPSAVVASDAVIGLGSVLLAGVVVNPGARIGANSIVNTAASVDHDCEVGNHVHLSPGVHLGGTVKIGEGCHLGVGVSVRNNVGIGAWTVVGVGAAVVSDLPGGVVAYGVPAKPLRPTTAQS